jgi:alpha-galactosidase
LGEVKRRVEAGELPVADREIERLASEVIHALETGEAAEVYGNVRNDTLIDGLPGEACVEVPIRVDGDGVHPVRIGELPPQCLALNRTFENVVQLTVRAVVEGSRDLLYRAALLDPNTAATLPPDRILDLVDDLIESHGELIPEPIRSAPRMRR